MQHLRIATGEHAVLGEQPPPTIGGVDEIRLGGGHLTLQGWSLALDASTLEGIVVSLAGATLSVSRASLGLPSPHVPLTYPLPGAARCGFEVRARTDISTLQDQLIIVRPVVRGRPGQPVVAATESSVPAPPQELVDAIGGGWADVAHRALADAIGRAGLLPTHRVLDIGCGIGRVAFALAHYLEPVGAYTGLDVARRFLEWPRRHLSARLPRCRFVYLDVASRQYNREGGAPAAECTLPVGDDWADTIFALSLFTHLAPPAAARYLREIGRTLKPGGGCLATWFLLNPESRAGIAAGTSAHDFGVDHGPHCKVVLPSNPEAAIAFDEAYVASLVREAGLEVAAVYPGNWCGRGAMTGDYQDQLILAKPHRCHSETPGVL